MIEISSAQDLKRLRRLALSSQGLLKPETFGRGKSGAIKAISHLGYVQIDTISVVERAHHHVLQTRVSNVKAEMLNLLLVNRDIFEYWSHAAAFLPMEDYRFSLPYKEAIKSGQTNWFKNPDRKLMANLLERIRVEGPLRSRDVEVSAKKQAGWWDWKPAKKALEQLYMQGDLMVSCRDGFQKTYDITERVLPAHVNRNLPSVDEFAAHLLNQQLRCHGVVSLKGLTYLRRNTGIKKTMKQLLQERLDQIRLEPIRLPDGEVYFIEKGGFESRLARSNKRLQILSPFDNCVIQRERLKGIFAFQYQIECYVPEAKRQYGYFCLPLLYQDEFIGRMDCKTHRKDRHFEIKNLHLETRFIEKKAFDQADFIAAFVLAVSQFKAFQGCDTASVTAMLPINILPALQKALME